jgi:esterase/lipase superfamily enzyme
MLSPRLPAFWVVAAALVLAGCAGPRAGATLEPTGHLVAGAKPVTIHAATTRKVVGGKSIYNGERADPGEVNYTKLVMSVPPSHEPGKLTMPEGERPNPKTQFVTVAANQQSGDEFLGSVRASLSALPEADRTVFVFIHGYNTTFDEAAYRFAQVAHDAQMPGVGVLFSWASMGSVPAYVYDRDSVQAARDPLERTLRDLATKSGARKINVFAHSMGNWLLVETLRQASINGDPTFSGKLNEIMMAAPDVDSDVFRGTLQRLGGRMPAETTLFISKDDRALAVSSRLAGGRPRVGEFSHEDYTKAGITVVDLSQVSTDDSSRHSRIFELAPLAAKFKGGLRQLHEQQATARALNVINPINIIGETLHAIGRTGEILITPGQ